MKKKFGEIEVADITAVKDEKDAPEAFARVQARLIEIRDAGTLSEEVFARAAEDMKTIKEEVDALKGERSRLAKVEEMAKLAIEAAKEPRGGSDEERAAAEIRCLPMRRRWTAKDKDETGVEISDAHYSLLQMPSSEIRSLIGEGPGYQRVRMWRNAHDTLYLTHKYMVQKLMQDPEELSRYLNAGGMKTLKAWKTFEAHEKFMRTFDTATSTAASEWVPTMFSAQAFEDLTIPVSAADAFYWFDMPHNPYGWPIIKHGNTRSVKIIGQGTATGTGGFSSLDGDNPKSGQLILAVKKVGRFESVSREIDQDSLVPVMAAIIYDMALEHGYARSISVLDGQPISSSLGTLDTGRSLTADSDVEDIASGCTPASYGVRRACHASATAVNFAGNFTTDGLAAMIGTARMAGELAYSAWFTGFAVAARAMVLKDASGANVYLTAEKAGALAANVRGQVATLMGRPLILDGMYREDLNASGIYDGSVTTYTSIMLARLDRFIGGNRQGRIVETSTDYLFNRDEVALRSTERYTFTTKIAPTTAQQNRCGVAGVGIQSYQ